ncbi:MAG: HAD family hydrolase [Thermodesulfobacteriota bacterium]
MLIFDFDGVLINSIDEVTVTAYNAVSGESATTLEELPGDLVALFQRNRFHARAAPDVFSLMDWCRRHFEQQSDHLLSPSEFQAILSEDDRPPEARREQFFKTRRRFVEKNRDAWFSLNAPYQPLWDALMERGGRRVVLLTSKNRAAAGDLCRRFDLQVADENIYSGDGGANKIDNMNRIHERFQRPAYTFVDDNLANLKQLDDHFNQNKDFLHLLMAAWGYVGPDDRDRAGQSGYPCITQTDLIHRLEEELPA